MKILNFSVYAKSISSIRSSKSVYGIHGSAAHAFDLQSVRWKYAGYEVNESYI